MMKVEIEMSEEEVSKLIEDHIRNHIFIKAEGIKFMEDKEVYISSRSYSGLAARVTIETKTNSS
jgi:hypothetical protein